MGLEGSGALYPIAIFKVQVLGILSGSPGLGLSAFTAMGPVSIPSQGTKIPEAMHDIAKKKKKKRCGFLYGFMCSVNFMFSWEDNIGEIQNQVTATDLQQCPLNFLLY